jgi:hypothetical protein
LALLARGNLAQYLRLGAGVVSVEAMTYKRNRIVGAGARRAQSSKPVASASDTNQVAHFNNAVVANVTRPSGDVRWRASDPHGRQGGTNTTGAVVDSGVLNPELLKGKKGGRIWPKMRLKDRIDAIIAHEYEELRSGGRHSQALPAAARTELPIS